MLIIIIAEAEFLDVSIDLPLSVAFHVCEGLRWYYPELIKTLHMSVFVTCTASVLGIGALTFDRYVAITAPLKYRLKMKPSVVKKITTILWVVSTLITVAYLKVDYIVYTFFYVNLILLFTVFVLVVVHYKISKTMSEERIKMNNMNLRTLDRNSRVTRAYFVLVVIFFICNLPTFVFSYVLNFCQTCECDIVHILRDCGFLTLMLGSAVNPFFYGFRLPHFKSALKKLCGNIRWMQRFTVNFNMKNSSLNDFESENQVGTVNKGATIENESQKIMSKFVCEIRRSLPNLKYTSYALDNDKAEESLGPVALEMYTVF